MFWIAFCTFSLPITSNKAGLCLNVSSPLISTVVFSSPSSLEYSLECWLFYPATRLSGVITCPSFWHLFHSVLLFFWSLLCLAFLLLKQPTLYCYCLRVNVTHQKVTAHFTPHFLLGAWFPSLFFLPQKTLFSPFCTTAFLDHLLDQRCLLLLCAILWEMRAAECGSVWSIDRTECHIFDPFSRQSKKNEPQWLSNLPTEWIIVFRPCCMLPQENML